MRRLIQGGAWAGAGALVLAALSGAVAAAPQRAGLRFEVSVPANVRAEPITGRVYVMISRTAEREPRLQIGRTGVPSSGGMSSASHRVRRP